MSGPRRRWVFTIQNMLNLHLTQDFCVAYRLHKSIHLLKIKRLLWQRVKIEMKLVQMRKLMGRVRAEMMSAMGNEPKTGVKKIKALREASRSRIR